MKKCYKCKKKIPLDNFYKNRSNKDGLEKYCKECKSKDVKDRYASDDKYRQFSIEYAKKHPDKIKAKQLKSLYNMSLDQYNELFYSQEGKCAICKTHQSKLLRSLSVDHDHTTKEIRGLLCGKCNRGLGYLQDSIEILENALNYLKKTVK